ncbi:MAG: hypothetical protein OHK0024_06140 [Thalassobaculales bacterium]
MRQQIALSRSRLHLVLPQARRGPGLLFIHGGFHGAWCFEGWTSALAEAGWPAAAIDLPGHGGLPPPADFIRLGAADFATDAAEALDAMAAQGIGEVVVAGHSLGAMVAMLLALARPVAGLILLAPSPPGNLPGLAALPAWPEDRPAPPPDAAKVAAAYLPNFDDAAIAALLPRFCAESPAFLNDRYLNRTLVPPERISAPVLVIAAEKERPGMHGPIDRATAAFFGGEYHFLAGAGHDFMLEDGRGLALVARWLERQFAAPPRHPPGHLFTPRALLFVPATRADFVAKAHQRGADAICLDLEDSIPEAEKAAARAALAGATAAIAGHGLPVVVRLNNRPAHLAADIEAAVAAGAAGVVLPKAETAAEVAALDHALTAAEARHGRPRGGMLVVVLLETPAAVMDARPIIAASPRVAAAGFGSEDFAVVLGVAPLAETLAGPAQMVALAALAEGRHPIGLPGSIAGFVDEDAFARVARLGRALGMRGAACIHPRQVAVLNQVYRPDAAALEEARALIAAYETGAAAGRGAIRFRDRMIDAPHVAQARRLLAEAAEGGGAPA